MLKAKKKRLESKGWKVGTVADFLNLSESEAMYVELKVVLSRLLKKQRIKSKLTQIELAKIVKSSQSRVAKMEAGDPSVSLDLLVRSLLTLKTTKSELARAISFPQDI